MNLVNKALFVAFLTIFASSVKALEAGTEFECNPFTASIKIAVKASLFDKIEFPKIYAMFKDTNGVWHETPHQNTIVSSGIDYIFTVPNFSGYAKDFNILVKGKHGGDHYVTTGKCG